MELKSRQTHILRNLMYAENGVSSTQLLQSLGIARRTFYYDIEKINDYLAMHDMGRVTISGSRIRAELTNINQLERLLTKQNSYFFSVAERRGMELIYIALASHAVTVQSIMDHFDISKNTALGDIKAVRENLAQWGLDLQSAIKNGYQIIGDEFIIRRMLWGEFQFLNNPEVTAAIKSFLQESMVSLTGNDIDFLELCRCLIKQYETDIQGKCFLQENGLESMMIQASWIRSHKGYEIVMNAEEQFALMKSHSYRSISFSAQKLDKLGMKISPNEIYYITSLFLGIRTSDFSSKEEENTYIDQLSRGLIHNFECIAGISFPNRDHLHSQLTHHVRPLFYRLKYGIVDKSPLVKDVQGMYPIVYDFTRRAAEALHTSMFDGLSEDELSYLCIYFASNLNEKFLAMTENNVQENALIVGAGNMATATLLQEQLENLFGFAFSYNVISVDRLRTWQLRDYALVVSLVPLGPQFTCEHVVQTGPILNEKDQGNILRALKHNQLLVKYDMLIQDLLSIAERNATGELQSQNMYFELLRYFVKREGKHGTGVNTKVHVEILKEENFLLVSEETSWEQAVLLGASHLQGERLVARMKKLVVNGKIQTYRFHPQVVLVHYPMQGEMNAVVDTRIILSEQGIMCEDGQKANIIVCISGVDHYSHWHALEDIYQYFERQNHVDEILGRIPYLQGGNRDEKN